MNCGARLCGMSKNEFYDYFYQIRDKLKMLTRDDRRLQKRYVALRRMEKKLTDTPCDCEYDIKCIIVVFWDKSEIKKKFNNIYYILIKWHITIKK